MGVKIRSRVLLAVCVGSQISWERFKLKMMSQNLADVGEKPHKESQLMFKVAKE